MKILLILLCTLFLVIIYYGYPLYKATRISKNIIASTSAYEQNTIQDAPQSREQNPPAIFDTPQSVARILVVGDSTGFGTGAQVPEESTAGRLGAYYPNAQITNISENGLRLAGLEMKLRTHLDSYNRTVVEPYDLILIQIGANDIIRLTPMHSIEERLNTILGLASKNSKKIIVLTSGNVGLSPVFRWPLSNFITHRTKQVRDIYIKNIGTYPSSQYIDLYKEREEDIFLKDISKYYAADKFHPSSDGYKVWFTEIEKSLK